MGRSTSNRDWRFAPPRILLAEDDPELRRLIGVVLRKEGYEIIEVGDGAEMLDFLGGEYIARRGKPRVDLVISDVRMPKRSGLDVVTGLRRSGQEMPVVFLSAFADREMYRDVGKVGHAALLSKPFDIDDLRLVVDYLVRTTI